MVYFPLSHIISIEISLSFIDDVISVIYLFYSLMSFCLYNKKNITRWLEDMNFIFEWQNNILRTSAASELNIVLPLENKIHIFAPPWNILHI